MKKTESRLSVLFFILIFFLAACNEPEYKTIIRGGRIYDGSGTAPYMADVGIKDDTIAFIGDLSKATAANRIDAKGLAVCPGFINMLSWATTSLLADGRSHSDILQGVTLEVMGEGTSMGPINAKMREDDQRKSDREGGKIKYDWSTLGEYLSGLERKGVSANVASFVGATTIRVHQMGLENRAATVEELAGMQQLVKEAMEEGAVGVGSSLIYAPGSFASTEELIAMCKTAANYDGMYISHIRSEGNDIIKAIDELIRIARESKIRAEIYHLKLAGKDNWNKLDSVVARIEKANDDGLKISADMYTYTAGNTGLDAAMPLWIQEGGTNEWIRRMKDPVMRKRALEEMRKRPLGWENLMRLAGSPDRVLLVDFRNDSMKQYSGKTLQQLSEINKKSPEETAMDLVCADSTRVGTIYFLMSEENIRKMLALPYVSLGSDASSYAVPEGSSVKSSVHPRAYGNFARFLGKYVRDEKVMSLEEAIHRLTSLPAAHLKIKKRGKLAVGYFADVAVFNPSKIKDLATFENPHQYSLGMKFVLVNGTIVVANGTHTGAKPGRFVKGPGWKKNPA